MKFRALTFLFLVTLASACGFQPLQGVQYRSSLAVDLSSIAIQVNETAANTVATTGSSTPASISRRFMELLKAELNDRINPMNSPGEKLFTLNINFTETDLAMFVRPDGTASRGNMLYNSTYTLTRIADQTLVASGTLQSLSNYNMLPTEDYASYVSIEDARKRASLDLAQTYQMRLATLLPTLNNPESSAIQPKPEITPALQPIHGYETSTPGH